MTITTIIDVIKEALGFALENKNKAKIKFIDNETLRKLDGSLQDFEWGSWAMSPVLSNDSSIFCLPGSSPTSINIGCTGKGTNYSELFTADNVGMNSRLSLLLTHFPHLSIESGLSYYIEMSSSIDDQYGVIAQKILNFYCDIAILIKNGIVLISPKKRKSCTGKLYFIQ